MAFKDYKKKLIQKNKREGISRSFFSATRLILFSIFLTLFIFIYTWYYSPENFFSSKKYYEKALGKTSIQNFQTKKTIFQQKWKFIVIHHSGIESGNAKIYDEYHQEKYKQELLYHFIIGNGNSSKDGEIEMSNRWLNQLPGGHVSVSNDLYNQKGIGICLVGNFEGKEPTENQLKQLTLLTKFLMSRFNIPTENVLLHSEINTTKCPGKFFPRDLFFSNLR